MTLALAVELPINQRQYNKGICWNNKVQEKTPFRTNEKNDEKESSRND
jgi:hypothetical protein